MTRQDTDSFRCHFVLQSRALLVKMTKIIAKNSKKH